MGWKRNIYGDCALEAGGLHGVGAGAIYMEIRGEEEPGGGALLPKQPRGHHTRLSLLDCSSIFVFAFVPTLDFFSFLVFDSATLVLH